MRNSQNFNGKFLARTFLGGREDVFATSWDHYNRRSGPWGCGVGKISKRERMLLGSLVQWFGSNIGWSWLTSVLERMGYKLVRTKNAYYYEREVSELIRGKAALRATNEIIRDINQMVESQSPEKYNLDLYSSCGLIRYKKSEKDGKYKIIKTLKFNSLKPNDWLEYDAFRGLTRIF